MSNMSVLRTLEWNISDLTVGGGAKKKTLLRGIRGEANSGDLIALMGPSGAGKTSLLECLSLRNKNFDGTMKLDGEALSKSFFTQSALVHQREALFGFLTVREHLVFQAKARLRRSLDEIMERVDIVIKDCKLSKCADTIIGGTDPLYTMKGISGGERRRVALATELLRVPEIVFLDEPTSGLDSTMAASVISTLKDLTKRGRMIITSIHSPSSDVVDYFTHLVLLSHDGRLAFHGPTALAIKHFQALGYTYPPNYNPADYLLNICSNNTDSDEAPETSRVDLIVDAFETEGMDIDNRHKAILYTQGTHVSSWTLFWLNYKRFCTQFHRDSLTSVLWMMLSIMTGLLYGILYYHKVNDQWRNLLGLSFSMTVSVLMMASMGMVIRLPLDWAVFQREYACGSNGIGPYLTARFAATWPLVPAPLIMGAIVYWMSGMAPGAMAFLEFTGIMALLVVCSLSLGTLCSAFHDNLMVCMSLLPGIVTPMILFSGLLYERSTVPIWLAWIQSVSIVNYGLSALMIHQSSMMPEAMAKMVLSFLNIDKEMFRFDLVMLAVLTMGFQLATFVVLKIRFSMLKSV